MVPERRALLTEFVYERFASEVGLERSELARDGVTLSEVVKRSSSLTNSVDLMECFARLSNMVRKEYGVRVRLPAFPANTTIKDLVDAFIEQAEAELSKGVST